MSLYSTVFLHNVDVKSKLKVNFIDYQKVFIDGFLVLIFRFS